MSEDWVEALPPDLRERPLDHKRKVPIPAMNVMPDGEVNFTVINDLFVKECGEQHLCGICGKPLSYWIAFVGGPLSAMNRIYSDPPFHVDCAKAAMRYCPHIARKVHRRTPDEKMPDGSFASPLADENKPALWIITVTRSFNMIPHGPGVLFRTGTIKHSFAYRYDDEGHLKEVVQ